MQSAVPLLALLALGASSVSALTTEAVLKAKVSAKAKAAEALMQLRKEKVWQTAQRIEDLEAWVDSGKEVFSAVKHDSAVKLSSGITKDSYDKMLHEFTKQAGASRQINHEGNKRAAAFIAKTFKDSGLEVKEHKYASEFGDMKEPLQALKDIYNVVADKNNGNIVAFKKGTHKPEEVILVGAHYDSVNWHDSGDVEKRNAPGVDDNASGVAALLLIAQALKTHDPRRSVLLVAFNGEEMGLLGSKAFARDVVSKKTYGNIKAAIIADEIAFPGRSEAAAGQKLHRRAIFETVGRTDPTNEIVDTLAHSVDDPAGQIAGFEVNYHGFGSDHISLLDSGVPAVLLIERDDEWHADTVGHSTKDTFDDLDMDYGATMSRLLLRAALKLANKK